MNNVEINQKYSELYAMLDKGLNSDVISSLESLGVGPSTNDLNEIRYSYNSLLDFFSSGAKDSQRGNILNDISERLYGLIADWRDSSLMSCGVKTMRSSIVNDLGKADIPSFIRIYRDSPDPAEKEIVISAIFDLIWTSSPSKPIVESVTKCILIGRQWGSRDIQTFLAAVILSLTCRFTPDYLSLLMTLCMSDDKSISSKAYIGVVLTLMMYEKRWRRYDRLVLQYDLLASSPKGRTALIEALRLIARSHQAQAIMTRVTDEITPQLASHMGLDIRKESHNELHERLHDLMELDPKLEKSIRQLDKWHVDGADVFFSTFRHLKGFEFFKFVSSWFIPFNPENPRFYSVLEAIPQSCRHDFLCKVSQNTLLCDSDKYSVILSVSAFPVEQREQLCEVYSHELGNSCIGASSYVNDLYRFFYVHPHRSEFNNPLEHAASFLTSKTCLDLLSYDEQTELADYFVSQDLPGMALHIYQHHFDNQQPGVFDTLLCKKLAHCLIVDKQYDKAKACLQQLPEMDAWTTRQLANIFRMSNDYSKEAAYLEQLLALKPADHAMRQRLGFCYEHLLKFDLALKNYFEVDYMLPSDDVKRGIYRCLWQQNKNDKAMAYIGKIISKIPDDNICLGCIWMVLGQFDKAIESFLEAANGIATPEEFVNKYQQLAESLLQRGVSSDDIVLANESVLKEKYFTK